MIIVMQSKASEDQVDAVVQRIGDLGLKPHVSKGEFRTIIGAIGDESLLRPEFFAGLAGVESVMPIMKPYKLASRDFHAEDTVLDVGGVKVGGGGIVVLRGPLLHREPRADARDGPGRPEGRRGPAPRRAPSSPAPARTVSRASAKRA